MAAAQRQAVLRYYLGHSSGSDAARCAWLGVAQPLLCSQAGVQLPSCAAERGHARWRRQTRRSRRAPAMLLRSLRRPPAVSPPLAPLRRARSPPMAAQPGSGGLQPLQQQDGLLLQRHDHQRLNAVVRQLKREQCSLWACCNSILEDERFVAEIRCVISGCTLGFASCTPAPPLPPTCAQLHCAVLCTLLRSRCVETPARSPLQAAVPQPPPCRQPALRPVVQPPLRRDLLLQIDRCGGARRVAQHSPGGALHGQSSAVQGATARRRLMHGCSRAPHLDTARVAPSLHIAHDHNIATGRRPQRVVGLFNDAAEPGAR